MPWPQNINLTDVALTKKFKVNITGNPNDRLFKGVSKFYTD
jgi:hexosaminidase